MSSKLDQVSRIIQVLFDWSGATDDTPDDTEVITSSSGMETITVGDLKEASNLIERMKEGTP